MESVKEEEIDYDDWIRFSAEPVQGDDVKDVLKAEPDPLQNVFEDSDISESDTESDGESMFHDNEYGSKEGDDSDLNRKELEHLNEGKNKTQDGEHEAKRTMRKDAKVDGGLELMEAKRKKKTNGRNTKQKSVKNYMTTEVVRACTKFTSTIGNKCEFTCPLCFKTFKYWGNVRRHCRRMHEGYAAPKIDFFSKIVCYKCKICSSNVVCDKKFLSNHFLNHNTTITEYGKMFDLSNETKLEHGKVLVTESEQENLEQYALKFNIRLKGGQIAESQALAKLFKGMESSETVGNLCTYFCKVCQKNMKTIRELIKHFKYTMHGTPCYNMRSALKFVQKSMVHTCKICNEVMLCDNFFISQHLKPKHKLTVKEYCQQFGLVSKDRYSILREKQKELLRNSELSDILENKCSFSCVKCPLRCSSWIKMKDHLRIKHVNQGLRAVDVCDTPSVFYQCKICFKKLLCDGHVFFKHLVNYHHGMRLTEYKGKYQGSKTAKSQVVADLCRYKCDHCQRVFQCGKTLRKHQRKVGSKTGGPGYLERLRIKTVLHQCRLCFKTVQSEITCIGAHVKRVHGMSVAEYMGKSGAKIESSVEALKEAHRVLLHKFISLLGNFEGSYPNLLLLSNQKDEKKPTTNCVGNLCQYKCPECDMKGFISISSLWLHYAKDHTGKARKFEPSQHMFRALYHCCILCQKCIPCDQYFFNNHLHSHKGINYTKYKTYVQLIGGVYFPSIGDFRKNQGKPAFEESLKSMRVRKCFVKLEKL